MQTQMTTRAIYARHTNTKGESYVASHVVWSTDETDGAVLFIAARQREAQKLNDDSVVPTERKAKVEQITHDTYLKDRARV
ncbi:hypothetical protein [Polaromonas sp.]|uniref:hypothetical protein n=1 Tax=Polaromonas sp. TaxID=1869339 RepID=UPI0032632227